MDEWLYPVAKVLVKHEGKVTAYKFMIAVPGITKDKVHISYTDEGQLEVGIDEHAPDDNNIEVVSNDIEFNGGVLTLSCSNLNLEKTKATVENGIITIIVPVNEKPKKNVIKIG